MNYVNNKVRHVPQLVARVSASISAQIVRIAIESVPRIFVASERPVSSRRGRCKCRTAGNNTGECCELGLGCLASRERFCHTTPFA